MACLMDMKLFAAPADDPAAPPAAVVELQLEAMAFSKCLAIITALRPHHPHLWRTINYAGPACASLLVYFSCSGVFGVGCLSHAGLARRRASFVPLDFLNDIIRLLLFTTCLWTSLNLSLPLLVIRHSSSGEKHTVNLLNTVFACCTPLSITPVA